MKNFTLKEASRYLNTPEEILQIWIKENEIETYTNSLNAFEISKSILDHYSPFNNKILQNGYYTFDILAKIFNVSDSTIKKWIIQKRFINIKSSNTSIVSIDDNSISESSLLYFVKQIQELDTNYMTTKEAINILGIAENTLHRWKNDGYFSNIFKWKRNLFIDKLSVFTLKEKLDSEKQMLSMEYISLELGLSKEKVTDLLRDNLQGSLRGNKLLISVENYEIFIKENKGLIQYSQNGTIPKGYFTTKMLAEHFNIDKVEAARWIRQGRFIDFKKIREKTGSKNSIYLVPESAVIKYEEFTKNLSEKYVTSDKAKDILGVSSSTLGNWITNKKFSGHILWLSCWYLPIEEVDDILSDILESQKGLITRNEAAIMLGFTHKKIKKYIKNNKFKSVLKEGKVFLFREQIKIAAEEEMKLKKVVKTSQIPNGFLSIPKAANYLNCSEDKIRNLINNNELGIPIDYFVNRVKGKAVSQNALINYSNKKNNSYTAIESATFLGFKTAATVKKYIHIGCFPNTFKSQNKYYITMEDLLAFKELKDLSMLPVTKNTRKKNEVPLSKNSLKNQLLLDINNIYVPNHLKKTKKYYLEYITIRISSLGGHISHFKSECTRAKKCFENIIVNLPNESFLISDDTIQEILSKDTYALTHRMLANWFFQYVFGVLGFENKKSFIIAPSPSHGHDDGKEIYTPEIYLEYLNYTKNFNQNIRDSIKSRYIANMWLYTIMHLMDTWRATDIVNNLLEIELDTLEINNLEWFLSNKLSIEQAQFVINQVYLATRYLSTSKTNKLLTFLVPFDFILPAGYAFIINELHRRHSGDMYLLETLISTDLKARTPNNQHLNFFRYNPQLKDFRSLVMNRSTMTYLFNSIVDDSPDPELALAYTQQTRSHQQESSTAVYVKATNFDGSLGNISLNLFNRGHFGWIYNTLIKLMLEDKNVNLSIDKRSDFIMNLRREFNPPQIEEWATFLRQMDTKREHILKNLTRLNPSEIKKLINAIFKGEMPSRNENGQCLTSPECRKPHLKSCFSCENFIPQVYAIIHIKEEIAELMASIESTKFSTIIERDSHFLKIYLLLLNEAISVYGQEYIQTFIDLPKVRQQVLQIRVFN